MRGTRKRPRIVTVACKRCGKSIVSSTRFADTELYRELGQICEKCITPNEEQRVRTETGLLMLRKCV